MTQQGRAQRVGELIRQEVARLITNGLKDPRVGFVSVMEVRMSPDLRYANIYVSLFGDERERKGSLVGLQHSAGWIRREVSKHLHLRVTPEFRFFEDKSLDQVYHLEEVLQEIREERRSAPMLRLTLQDVVDELRKAQQPLVVSHGNPDGDAVGSMLALYHLLRAMGKEPVRCALSDPVPELYRTLPGASSILTHAGAKPSFDVAFLVDASRLERAAELRPWLEQAPRVVVIDHHLEDEPEGAAGFIDASYAAAGEIVAELFAAADIPLSTEAAHCVYVAQVTDTGGYRYPNTNARSHRIAATLHETGLDTASVCERVFGVIALPKFELLRLVLERIEFLAAGAITTSFVTAADLDSVGGFKEDLNGLINHLRNIEGVRVGVLFNAIEDSKTKVSLRAAPNFNAAAFLANYGGGGHAAAAGATLEMPLNAAREMLLGDLVRALGEGP